MEEINEKLKKVLLSAAKHAQEIKFTLETNKDITKPLPGYPDVKLCFAQYNDFYKGRILRHAVTIPSSVIKAYADDETLNIVKDAGFSSSTHALIGCNRGARDYWVVYF